MQKGVGWGTNIRSGCWGSWNSGFGFALCPLGWIFQSYLYVWGYVREGDQGCSETAGCSLLQISAHSVYSSWVWFADLTQLGGNAGQAPQGDVARLRPAVWASTRPACIFTSPCVVSMSLEWLLTRNVVLRSIWNCYSSKSILKHFCPVTQQSHRKYKEWAVVNTKNRHLTNKD